MYDVIISDVITWILCCLSCQYNWDNNPSKYEKSGEEMGKEQKLGLMTHFKAIWPHRV